MPPASRGNFAGRTSPLRGVPVRRRAHQCGRVHSTPAAGALLTGLTTLAAVTGCVTVSPEPGTGPGTGTRTGPDAGWPAASGPAASPLPGREDLATIGPVRHPRPRHSEPSAAPSGDTVRPGAPAPGGPSTAPPARALRPEPARPARTAGPAAPTPPPPTAAGGDVDVCALAGDYGRWAPGSREEAACAEYFER